MDQQRQLWQFMSVVRDVVLDMDGFIFGGFVRDSIIHDHFASKYYEVALHGGNKSLYNNPLFMPDTWDRTTMPSDLDCFMTEVDFTDMLKAFARKRILAKVLFIRDPRNYVSNIEGNDTSLKHIRLAVTVDMSKVDRAFAELPIRLKNKSIQSPYLKMDVLISKKSYAEPFLLLMEIENGTSPNTDVAIYSGLLVAPERIDNYVFTERLTRFLLCLR